MLAIRMQRTGRKGHAMFRVIVQDSQRTPTSGKVVAQLGSYDPHVKNLILNKDKAAFYLEHGAQPSERVARLLKNEGVKLPDWVKLSADKERTVRHAEKRRSTRPPEPVVEAAAAPEAPVAEEALAAAEAKPTETETPAAEAAAPEAAVETPEVEEPVPVPVAEAEPEAPEPAEAAPVEEAAAPEDGSADDTKTA